VHRENYHAVMGTDVDLLKHPAVIDRRRRSLQDIVFRTRVVYLKGAR
jgi:hypothetical protein